MMKRFLAGTLVVSLLGMPAVGMGFTNEAWAGQNEAADILANHAVIPLLNAAVNDAERSAEDKNLIDNVRIFYNASLVSTAQPALLENGRFSLALRDFFEGIGVPVEWDSISRSATVTTENKLVVIYPDTGKITINGQPMLVEALPQMVGYHIYVPLRFLSEQLGYEVAYSVENDTHVVRITGTAPELLKVNDGAVTRIKNRTIMPDEPENAQHHDNYTQWKENHVRYFVDANGLLHQLVSTGNTDKVLEIRHIDPAKAAVDQSTYTLPETMMALGPVTAAGQKSFELTLDPAQSSRYVGIGEPISTKAAAIFDTGIGCLLLYSSKATDTILSLDTQNGAVKGTYEEPQHGYVLDTIELDQTLTDTSYAVSNDGRYAFLLDGYLLIIDPSSDESIYSELLSGDLEDGSVTAIGDRFIITGTENSHFTGHMGFYTAVYNNDGQCQRFYTNQTAKHSQTDWGYLQVLDQYTKGSMIYTLLKTNWDNYLAVYDAEEDIFSLRELPYPYTNFIPSPEGEQLFLSDIAYFYLQPVE